MGYKLLTKEMKTRKGYQNEMDWADVGEWHEATGHGGLCTAGMIHDYDDPWIAVVLNPVHADITSPVMYETERGGDVVSDGLKCGCKRLRLVRRVDIPDVPLVQCIAFGILAAMQVHRRHDFVQWAEKWLSGEDRSAEAAREVWRDDPDPADAAAFAAAFAAESAIADASAAFAAESVSAAHAADAADAADDAYAAIDWQAIKAQAMQIV